MSAALLRKSLELVDSSRPSGFTQANAPKLSNEGRSRGKQEQEENPELAAISDFSTKSSRRKNRKINKRKAVLSKLTGEEQELVEENVRRLLQLSSSHVSPGIAQSVIKRTLKAPKEVKSKKNLKKKGSKKDFRKKNGSKTTKKEEESVFTDADFDDFSKSYFGS